NVSEKTNVVGFEADFAFHRVLVKSAYNPFLTETMNNLASLHLRVLNYSLSKNLGWEDKRKNVYLEHEKIYNAVKNRDSKAARNAVIDHLTNTRIKLGDKRVTEK